MTWKERKSRMKRHETPSACAVIEKITRAILDYGSGFCYGCRELSLEEWNVGIQPVKVWVMSEYTRGDNIPGGCSAVILCLAEIPEHKIGYYA